MDRKRWYTVAGAGGAVFTIFATNTDFLKRSMTAPFKGVPNRLNPLVPEADGGPRLTNQPPKSGDSSPEYSTGSRNGRVSSRGGADEQAGRGRHHDESDHDDDDFTGGSGASDDVPVAVGDVDPDFDALPFVYGGAAALFIGLIVLGAYAALRSGGAQYAHA